MVAPTAYAATHLLALEMACPGCVCVCRYVQTVKPGWMGSPVFRVFARTVREAWELVEPVFRFGLPANSIRDKCPYWRCVQAAAAPHAALSSMFSTLVLHARGLLLPGAIGLA